MDFSSELGRLLVLISNVAVAIRLNSAYSGDYASKDKTQVGFDVMWLSDTLHEFKGLGAALQSKDLTKIVSSCDGLTMQFEAYLDEKSGPWKSDPSDTFDRYREFVNLEEFMGVVSDIRTKALGLS